MIRKENTLIHITLPRVLVESCKKHKMRVTKIAREATEDALREKLERIEKKVTEL